MRITKTCLVLLVFVTASSGAGCGDGILAPDEKCDDGNYEDGDGCSSQCVVESGFSCSPHRVSTTGSGSVTSPETVAVSGLLDVARRVVEGSSVDSAASLSPLPQPAAWPVIAGRAPFAAVRAEPEPEQHQRQQQSGSSRVYPAAAAAPVSGLDSASGLETRPARAAAAAAGAGVSRRRRLLALDSTSSVADMPTTATFAQSSTTAVGPAVATSGSAAMTTAVGRYVSVCKPDRSRAQTDSSASAGLAPTMVFAVAGGAAGVVLIVAVLAVVVALVVRHRRRIRKLRTGDPETGASGPAPWALDMALDLGMPAPTPFGGTAAKSVAQPGQNNGSSGDSKKSTLKLPIRKPLPAVRASPRQSPRPADAQQQQQAPSVVGAEAARHDDPPTDGACDDIVFLRGRKPEHKDEEASSETEAADFSSESDNGVSDSDASDRDAEARAFAASFLTLDSSFLPPSAVLSSSVTRV